VGEDATPGEAEPREPEAREVETGTPEVRCRVEARVARVLLDRPDARNALTLDMKRALVELLPAIDGDPGVGCVLLTGAGASFCSGGDTKMMAREGRPPSYEERVHQLRWEHRIPLALHAMGVPTVAALPGPAAGAGLSLLLARRVRGATAIPAILRALGTALTGPAVAEGELYSYAVALMVAVLGCLAVAVLRRPEGLRRIEMVGVALTVAKVFVIDMGGLAGLWRVAAFLGLGLSLAALAWINARIIDRMVRKG